MPIIKTALTGVAAIDLEVCAALAENSLAFQIQKCSCNLSFHYIIAYL